MAECCRFMGSIAKGLKGEAWVNAEGTSDDCKSCEPGISVGGVVVVVVVGRYADRAGVKYFVVVWV